MQPSPWEDRLAQELLARFGSDTVECLNYLGQDFVQVRRDSIGTVLEYLKTEARFDSIVDITAVDYPKREERFDLIYILYSHPRNERVRVKTRLREDDEPETASRIWPGANWLEREIFDMFGIRFTGHPGLRRILLPDDWHGHPLRKDSSILAMDQKWVKENLGIESGQ